MQLHSQTLRAFLRSLCKEYTVGTQKLNRPSHSFITLGIVARRFGTTTATFATNQKSSSNTTLTKISRCIQDCTNTSQEQPTILVLCGAGVSVAAGIPDFRTPGTGLYDNLQRYNLPYPEAVFDVNYFREYPQAFMALSKEIWPGLERPCDDDTTSDSHSTTSPSPTLTHSFLALLEKKNLLLRCYTQNIDGLEVIGGVSPSRIVECHGHFRSASCIHCGAQGCIERVKRYVLGDKNVTSSPFLLPGEPPICDVCKIGYVKPDIVFFGEQLPSRVNQLLEGDLKAAKLLIIMGTSLQVGKFIKVAPNDENTRTVKFCLLHQILLMSLANFHAFITAPVAMIPNQVPYSCRRILLNHELVGHLNITETKEEEPRDLFHSGDCDSSVQAICRELNWEDELYQQNESSRSNNRK